MLKVYTWFGAVLVAFLATYFTGILTAVIPPPKELLCRLSLRFCPGEESIVVDAADFWDQENVNVAPANDECYAGLVLNQPPYEAPGNSATYKVSLKVGGRFRLLIQYAALESRPLNVDVNEKKKVLIGAASGTSGSWCNTHLRWDKAGEVQLSKGDNFIRLYTDGFFPHLKTIKFSRIRSEVSTSTER
jgi:hypothetical protein